ncbi:uncharacterized protein At4g04775-like [Chenopodium quinoa]|uniref:uncharacterized protein At4g04775-like n=1 Tax=Chenopodium quinoa TaxID=63459 RepID=UPI000B799822|nr:uncharacterized protein At4g04775-like [Chenopodium quinoa]
MSNSSYESARPIPGKCYCGIPPKVETSWTSTNPGRKFVACKFYDAYTGRRGYNFFEWIDVEIVEWQRVITNQLVLEKKLMKAEIANLKQEVCLLQDQNARLVEKNEKFSKKLKGSSLELKNSSSPAKSGYRTVGFYVVFGMMIMYLAFVFMF